MKQSKLVTAIASLCAIGVLNSSMLMAAPTVVIKQPVRPGPANSFNVAPYAQDYYGTTYGQMDQL